MTQNNFSMFLAGICDKPWLCDGLMTTRSQAWRFGWHFQILCSSSRLNKIDSSWMFRTISGGGYPCCEYLLSDKHENTPWKDHILSQQFCFSKRQNSLWAATSNLANYLMKKPKGWVSKLCLWKEGAIEAGDIGKASNVASKGVVLRNSWPRCSEAAERRKWDGPAPPDNQH